MVGVNNVTYVNYVIDVDYVSHANHTNYLICTSRTQKEKQHDEFLFDRVLIKPPCARRCYSKNSTISGSEPRIRALCLMEQAPQKDKSLNWGPRGALEGWSCFT